MPKVSISTAEILGVSIRTLYRPYQESGLELEEEFAQKILEAIAGFAAALDSSNSQERKFVAQI